MNVGGRDLNFGGLVVNRLLVSVLLIAAAGCQPSQTATDGGGTPGAGSDKTLRIAVIPKGTSHEHWQCVHEGAKRAAAELDNVEVIWKGPQTEADTAGQISVVKNFITKRVDGICLAPTHSEALVDVVVEANDENIPVVILDSGLGEGGQFVSYVATDNFNGGKLAGHRMAETLNSQGDVILLRYRAGSESTEQREAGFLEAMKEYPNINILSSDQYGEATTESAMKKAQSLLLKYQDQVDGIFAVCEPNANGTLEALQQAGLAGKVKFVAFDPSEGLVNGLRDDTVVGIIVQDPITMGYESVKAIVAHLRGEKVPSTIPTGEYVATKENMSDAKMHQLLNPLRE